MPNALLKLHYFPFKDPQSRWVADSWFGSVTHKALESTAGLNSGSRGPWARCSSEATPSSH